MLFLLSFLFCFPVQAHHGFRGYDRSSTQLSGTIVQVSYANPHVTVQLKTPKDDTPFEILFPPPWSMTSRGLPENKLVEGSVVTVVGNLNSHDLHEVLAAQMEINGQTVVFRGGLSDTEIAHAMHSDPWLFPLIEIFHILGFAIVVGATSVFDFRLLGFGRKLPVSKLAKLVVPLTLGAMGFVVLSGGLLFLSDVDNYLSNRAFQIKLALLVLAGVNATVFHLTVFKSVGAWEERDPPWAAKVAGAVSLILWIGILSAGRWIAFV